jgi:hypothetical protein
VPAFKTYVVQLDRQCNPVSFDRNTPIRTPDSTSRYRHMGFAAEWGDGQPTISPDGNFVAFWSMKSSDLANTYDNCAGFESADNAFIGNGAPRIRLCHLDSSHQKCASLMNLPQPTNPWDTQGGAYFYRQDNGNMAIFSSETTGVYLTDLVTGLRTHLFNGFGGYPISPRPPLDRVRMRYKRLDPASGSTNGCHHKIGGSQTFRARSEAGLEPRSSKPRDGLVESRAARASAKSRCVAGLTNRRVSERRVTAAAWTICDTTGSARGTLQNFLISISCLRRA